MTQPQKAALPDNADLGMFYIYQQTLLSSATSQIFFEPVKFNLELAYLAIQFLFA